MKSICLAPFCWLAFSTPIHAQVATPATAEIPAERRPIADCRTILDRYLSLLMDGDHPKPADIQRWMESLTPDGNWPDIDYTDRTLSNWKPLRHMDRVVAFYTALRQPGTPLFGDAKVQEAAGRSLHWWLLHKPTESQWYHSQISVPRKMRDIILLAGDDLQGEDRALAMKQLEQFKVAGTGANLVWSADLALHDAALRGDDMQVAAMSKRLSDEIKISDFEGIRDDWSFHQHGPRLQTFHYGQSYFAESTRLAWQLCGTPWAFPTEKTDLLVNLVLQGWSWQLRGNNTVPSTLDRAVSRPGSLRVNQVTNLKRLAEVAPEHAQELSDFSRAMAEGQPPVLGFKWFPRSDFASYQTLNASFFLKTVSSRTNTSESINGENQLGAQLDLGNQFILKTGDEYFDLMPSWDWNALPGVTWPDWAGVKQPSNTNRETTVIKQPFSGAATDGKGGVVAWQEELQSADKARIFSVRKATFAYGNTVVALWSDPNHGDGGESQTTLEQNRWRGEIWGGTTVSNDKLAVPGAPTVQRDGLDWVNHNGTGYIALQPGSLNFGAGLRSGTWKAINTASSAEPVTNPVFTSWIGSKAGRDQNGYVVLLNASPSQTQALAAKPTWRVLTQTPDVMAVRFETDLPTGTGQPLKNGYGTTMAAFFGPGQIPYGWSVDRACLLLFNGTQMWASDPLQQGGTLHLTCRDKTPITIELPKNGSSVVQAAPGFGIYIMDQAVDIAAIEATN